MAGYTLTSINKLRLTNEDRESWYADYIRNMNIIDGKLLSANAVTNSMLAADAVEDENVAAAAAIQRSKLASGSADHVVINNASGVMSSEATLAKTRGGTGADNSSVTFPSTGVIVTRDATETLTNKTIDGDDNILQDISISSLKTVLADANKVILRDASGVVSSALLANVNVSASAAIAYSKLNLSGSILNADINASAGIERSKLASGTASHVIINDGSGVLSSEARLSLDRTIDGTDNYVLVANGSGVNPGYALLLDNNIDASAAIARTKVANGTADHVIINNGSGTLSSEAQLSVSRGGTGLSALGTSNQVLGVNNAGNAFEYKTISAGTTGTDFAVAHSANTVTLNLPTASALNRGALSTSDWSTFNSKVGGSGANGQVALFSGTGTLTSDATIVYTVGANTNNISLNSGLKLGANTTAANTAGAGSLRYNSGVVEYSDGINWNTFGVTGAGILTLNSLSATAQSFANDTNVTITSATATHTLGWSGQLSIARGGTGLGTLGTSNQILGVDNGATAAEYKTLSVGTSGTDFAIAHSAGGVAFNLPDAGASARGLVTTGTQTLAGVKTFSSNAVFSSYVTLGDIISRDNSDGSVSVSSGQTLWHPNLDIQTGHTYSIAGQMVLVDELTGAGTVDGDGTVFDTSTDLTGYSRLAANESVTGQKIFSLNTIFNNGLSVPTPNANIIQTGVNAVYNGTQSAVASFATNLSPVACLGVMRYTADAQGPLISISKARESTQTTPLNSGDNIGFLTWEGSDGTANKSSVATEIYSTTTEAWSPTSHGAKLTFLVTANGSTTNVVALTLGQDKSAAFTGLLDISASTAGQIKFPTGTSHYSGDPNTLDDYEKGSFTASIAGTSTAGTYNYSSRTAGYTKIGRMVFCEIFLVWSSSGSDGTGSLSITGLPFTSRASNLSAASIGYIDSVTLTANNYATAFMGGSSTVINMNQSPNGGGSSTGIPIDHAGGIVINIHYEV